MLACGALAREILALKAANGWEALDLWCLPAKLHNTPDMIPDAAMAELALFVSKGQVDPRPYMTADGKSNGDVAAGKIYYQGVCAGCHGLDGKKVKTPSIMVKPSMQVSLRERSKKVERVTAALDALENKSLPQWLEIDKESQQGTIKQLPVREDITLPIDEQLIVELYSR